MTEIMLIKQVHPPTATPCGLHSMVNDRFKIVAEGFTTEEDARAHRARLNLNAAYGTTAHSPSAQDIYEAFHTIRTGRR